MRIMLLVALLLGGQDMVLPEGFDWNQLEKLAEEDETLRSALGIVADRVPEMPSSTNTTTAINYGQDETAAKELILAHEGDDRDPDTGNHIRYKDSRGYPTIGYGHRIREGDNFPPEGISDARALALFQEDYDRHLKVLYAELALNEGSMFADSRHSYAKNNWQYALLNPVVGENIEFIDGGQPNVTAKSNGNTTIKGFANMEELLAAGQARYEQMPTHVQAAVLSMTFNYGSAGPQTIRIINEAINAGSYDQLATHYRTNLANEANPERRADEANLIENKVSQQVIDSKEQSYGTLNKLYKNNPLALTDIAMPPGAMPVPDESRVLNEARTAGGSPSVFMTPAQIAQNRQLNLSAEDLDPNAIEGVQEEQEEVGSYLDFFIDQYGGYGLLLGDENNPQFDIGLVYSGGNLIRTVPANSPEADQVINIIDYIDQNGITSDSIIFGLLQKTEWWMSTDSAARAFDIAWSEMSEPEKQEYLEPLMKVLRRKADQLGFVYDENDLYEKAQTIMRLGNDDDEEFLNKFVFADSEQASIVSDATDFGSLKDSVFALADKYLLPLNDDDVIPLAEQLFTGDLTDAELQQEFKNRAVGLFPTMQKVIQELGITPKQYFSSHISEIERLLERPIDFKREFLDVVEHVDADGNVRPKTLSETRKRVRKTREWQSSQNAEDEAREVAAVIGEVFGKVAY